MGILIVSSCKSIFKTSPYKSYIQSLKTAGLAETNMGKSWIDKGAQVLSDPNTQLNYPFKEELFFQQHDPSAIAYQISYQKSSKIKFTLKATGKDQKGVFVDLFKSDGDLKRIMSEQLKDTSFIYEDDHDQTLLLRIQPQLLVNEHVEIEIAPLPKLSFPVKGGGNRNIQSFWGSSRDGGVRKHEGVDIFYERGTPILAVGDGVISRVQTTKLGGKVVWERLGLMGPSIYYAHLDSQLVSPGKAVKKGEVLGLMGNTGNALSTSPHLHFGIYTAGGAIDPLNYILKRDSVAGKVRSAVKYLGEEVMIHQDGDLIPIAILGVSTAGITYKVESGAIKNSAQLNIGSPKIKIKPLQKRAYIFDETGEQQTAIGNFDPKSAYTVLGFKKDSLYLQQGRIKGWVFRD